MLALANPWLLLIVVAPLLLRRLGRRAYREPEPFLTVPFLSDLSAITGKKPSTSVAVSSASISQRIVLVFVWCLLVLSLGRPQWIQEPLTKTLPGRDLLIAVDLSGSMAAEDFTDAAGNRSDRLTAVKEVMDDFLARRDGDRVGLMFFGNAAFMQVPFTEDLAVCRILLNEAQVGMAGPQTMLGDAVGKAISVFKNSDVKEKVLIVLADGNDTGSLVPPVKAAEIARDEGIKIHTIAMGDPTTVGEDKLDVDTLKAIAQATGGEMFMANNRQELEGVYNQIDAMTTRQVETLTHRPVKDLYFWPLAAAIVLVVLYHALKLWQTRRIAKEAQLLRRPGTAVNERRLPQEVRSG